MTLLATALVLGIVLYLQRQSIREFIDTIRIGDLLDKWDRWERTERR